MKKIVRLAGLSVMALSLTTGVAAANSGSIGTTGPDSKNKVEIRNSDKRKVENNNRVGVSNNNWQKAVSGEASVRHNTTGGDAETGDAGNDNGVIANVGINNSASGAAALGGNSGGTGSGTIENTGPDSYNKVSIVDTSKVKVENNNSVKVSNNSNQQAYSGQAKVSDNTTGGNATTGNASNVSTLETTINITN